MYWLDTALIVLVILGAGLGLWSGFLWQVARLLSLGLALTATVLGNEPATSWLHGQLFAGAEERVVQAVAYVAVFVLAYIVVFYVARLAQQGIRTSDLEWLDRLLGAGLGAGKVGLVLAGLCLAAAHHPHPTTQGWLKESRLAPAFAQGLEAALAWLPDRYRAEIAQGYDGVREMFGAKEQR